MAGYRPYSVAAGASAMLGVVMPLVFPRRWSFIREVWSGGILMNGEVRSDIRSISRLFLGMLEQQCLNSTGTTDLEWTENETTIEELAYKWFDRLPNPLRRIMTRAITIELPFRKRNFTALRFLIDHYPGTAYSKKSSGKIGQAQ